MYINISNVIEFWFLKFFLFKEGERGCNIILFVLGKGIKINVKRYID